MGSGSSRSRGPGTNANVPQHVFAFQNGEYVSQGGQPQDMYRNINSAYVPAAALSRQRPPPQPAAAMQETKTIKNPVHLVKNSLETERDTKEPNIVYLSFLFDAITAVEVTLYLAATELDADVKGVPQFKHKGGDSDPPRRSFPAGMKQKYRTEKSESLNVLDVSVEELQFKAEEKYFPIVVQLRSLGGQDGLVQSQYTYVSFEKGEKMWIPRCVQQKVQYGTHSYAIQEIFGIGEAAESQSGGSASDLSCGRECVVCLSEDRDTAVLPCRHMCLCSQCANIMRMHSNKCPICRQSVTRLMQITVDHKTPKSSDGQS